MAARRTRIKAIANIPQRNKPGISLIKEDLSTNSQLRPSTDEKNDKEEPNLTLQHVISEQSCILASDLVSECHGQSMSRLEIFENKEQDILVAQVDAKVALQSTAKPEKTIEQLESNRNLDKILKPCLNVFTEKNFRNENELQSTQIVKCEEDKIGVESNILVKHTQKQDLSEITAAEIEPSQNAKVVLEEPNKFEIPTNQSKKVNRRRFIKPTVSLDGLKRKVKDAESSLPKNDKSLTGNEIISSSEPDKSLEINTFNQRSGVKHDATLGLISATSLTEEFKHKPILSNKQDKLEVEPFILVKHAQKQGLPKIQIGEITNEPQQNIQFVVEESNKSGTHQNETTLPQKTNRRRFIKSPVFLTSLNKKVKSVESNLPKRDKIVILDEIITMVNSDKPLEINECNQKLEETLDETAELTSSTLRAEETLVEESIEKPIEKSFIEHLIPPPSSSKVNRTRIKAVPRVGQKLEETRDETVELTSSTLRAEEISVEEPIEKPIEKSFIEHLIPPPSPSKVNRTRIKAVPRVGQRHTSFSASESEDESRRNSRHRNDSVCSTTSGLQDTNSMECLSPQKPREYNTLIQRKCRRTEQSRKLAEARRDFYLKFGNQKPDKEKLTMIDFIFYNPTTNLMTDSKSKNENKEVEEKQDEEENGKNEDDNEDNTEKQASDEENEVPAPQIKIGVNGEIEIDEQSLVIENKGIKKNREKLEKQKIIDADLETGYGIYKRAKRSKDWNKDETLKFYKALNTIGTDFTLMCELFPRRSRRELKLKFKKEERINKTLIDRAIMKPSGFDFNDFKNEVELEEQELKEVEKQKERELQMKKETKKRKLSNSKTEVVKDKVSKSETAKPLTKKKKPFDIMRVLDDNSDVDASESGSNSMDSFETDTSILEAMKKPTRSGRVPKILKRYQSSVSKEPKCASKAELGSLVVVTETGSDGEPVFKVCMVTEDDRHQNGRNTFALQSQNDQENGGLENIFTLTATPLVDVTIPDLLEEQNITIPADETIHADVSTA